MKRALILSIALTVLATACGRSVTAPELTASTVAQHCWVQDSTATATVYRCNVRFAPTK